MELNIVNEVATLQRMTIGQLRQRFAELFGEATQASNRTWLVKRIAWRMQALAEGDQAVQRRLAGLVDHAHAAPTQLSQDLVAPPEPRRGASWQEMAVAVVESAAGADQERPASDERVTRVRVEPGLETLASRSLAQESVSGRKNRVCAPIPDMDTSTPL